jgi:hypothetical protein
MDIKQTLRQYSKLPISHHLLMSILSDYKRPNDKIHGLLKEGVLSSIKKGLYIAGPALYSDIPEPFLIANHIMGPSYISLDSALSYYGLIPERVYETMSVTVKASKKFSTSIGTFSFTKTPLPYYAYGIRYEAINDHQCVMIASPEKALFDKVITSQGVIIRSKKNAESYLTENLRISCEDLKSMNTQKMQEWIAGSPKSESLAKIIKTIEAL